jgi:hypothetical protein
MKTPEKIADYIVRERAHIWNPFVRIANTAEGGMYNLDKDKLAELIADAIREDRKDRRATETHVSDPG